MLFILLVLTPIVIFVPAVAAQVAGRDAWISVLLSGIVGAVSFIAILRLATQFPQKTLGEFGVEAFGKLFGGLIILGYIIYFLFFCYMVIVTFGQVVNTVLIPEMPTYVIYLLVLIPGVYAALLGITVPARLAEILLPIAILTGFVVMLLNYPAMDFTNYLPVLEQGIQPVLEGTMAMGSRLMLGSLLLVVFPLVVDKKKLGSYGMWAVLITVFLLLVGTLPIAMYGASYTAVMHFPIMEMMRDVQFAQLLERLDPMLVIMWMASLVILLTCFIYAAAALTRDLIGLKDYRGMVLVYGVLIFILTIVFKTSIVELRELVAVPMVLMHLAFGLVLPLIMLTVVAIKKGLK